VTLKVGPTIPAGESPFSITVLDMSNMDRASAFLKFLDVAVDPEVTVGDREAGNIAGDRKCMRSLERRFERGLESYLFLCSCQKVANCRILQKFRSSHLLVVSFTRSGDILICGSCHMQHHSLRVARPSNLE
jgi:hypothetical protein